MKLIELLNEAKVKMRDTKGTRDKAIDWVLSNGKTFTERATKDASIMNNLVSILAKVAGKKMKGGKYSLTTADFKKIDQAKFTPENLNKTLFKKITGVVGGGKPNSKYPRQSSKLKSAPKVDKEIKFGMDYEGDEIKLNGITIVKIEDYHTTNYPDNMKKIITTLLSKEIYNKLAGKMAYKPAGALFQDNGVYGFVGGEKRSKQISFVKRSLENILVELSNMANVKEELVKSGYTKVSTNIAKPPHMRKEVSKEVKEALMKDIIGLIGGHKVSNRVEYEKEERIFLSEAVKKAHNKAKKLNKYFDFNKAFDIDSGENYDPEWSDFAPKWEYVSYRPKDNFKHILKKVSVGAKETGDYAGDYTEISVIVFFN